MEGRTWSRRKTQEQRQNVGSSASHSDYGGVVQVSAVSPGSSDTPPAKQEQPPELVGGILLWKELRLMAPSLPALCLRDVCMSKLHPSHATIPKESALLLNAGEHRDATSQVSAKAGNGTSINVTKTGTKLPLGVKHSAFQLVDAKCLNTA